MVTKAFELSRDIYRIRLLDALEQHAVMLMKDPFANYAIQVRKKRVADA